MTATSQTSSHFSGIVGKEPFPFMQQMCVLPFNRRHNCGSTITWYILQYYKTMHSACNGLQWKAAGGCAFNKICRSVCATKPTPAKCYRSVNEKVLRAAQKRKGNQRQSPFHWKTVQVRLWPNPLLYYPR